jgi:hypothetical protein
MPLTKWVGFYKDFTLSRPQRAILARIETPEDGRLWPKHVVLMLNILMIVALLTE